MKLLKERAAASKTEPGDAVAIISWGYAEFEYDAASDRFRPGNPDDTPPHAANDPKCGFACHTIAAAKDYVFTAYQKR